MKAVELTEDDFRRVVEINAEVRGYSGAHHYGFFKGLFAENPQIRNLLILGVYQGRDIAFMLDILKRYHPGREVWITGVDKFSDTPCADWPEGTQGKNWEQAGFGRAPSVDQAWANVYSPFVRLEPMDDSEFLSTTDQRFDAVYLDTSHDYETVMRQCRQVRRVCGPDAIICGDDYSDESNVAGGNWGVSRAVKDSFTDHEVFANWIWISSAAKLKNT